MSKNDGVYTPHVHYRTRRNEKQVIDRKTIDWFVDKLLEFQQLSVPNRQMYFEINKHGFVVMVWQRDYNEDGLRMWYYETAPETETHRDNGIMTVRDPYLAQAKLHVEQVLKEAQDEADI
jgi:hypothetical protein